MKIVTSLSFQGQCREACEYYAKALGGKITAAIPYGDAPPGMPVTAGLSRTPRNADRRQPAVAIVAGGVSLGLQPAPKWSADWLHPRFRPTSAETVLNNLG
jgi:uncharacterized glyoxalase superfamily protein PhnB